MFTGISGSKQVLSWSQACCSTGLAGELLGGGRRHRRLADRVGVLALDADHVAAVGHDGVGPAQGLGDVDGGAGGQGHAVAVGDRGHFDVAAQGACFAHASLRADRALAVEGGLQRVPGQARALDPGGELADPREHRELAELGVGVLRGLRWDRPSPGRGSARRAPRPRPGSCPLRASVMSDAEAVEIEQPAPLKLASAMRSPSRLRKMVARSPQRGLKPVGPGGGRRRWRGSSAASSRGPGSLPGRAPAGPCSSERPTPCLLLQANISLTLWRPCTSASSSSLVLKAASEARAVAGIAEALHHRLGAMVTGAHRDALVVEDGADVVGMDRPRSRRTRRWPSRGRCRRGAGPGPRASLRVPYSSSSCSWAAMACEADPAHPVDGRAQSHGARDVGRARLELVGQAVPGGLLEAHGQDHVAAALPGRHGLEQLLLAVEHAHSRRPVELVRGEAVEVAAEGLHVESGMGHALRSVHEDGDAAGVGRSPRWPSRG